MLNLKQFRDRAKGTADLLNYATLVDDGLVLCKDGSLLGGFLYRGPDTASATPSELNYTTSRINAALARLGTGYALWVEFRPPSGGQLPRAGRLAFSRSGHRGDRGGTPRAVLKRRRAFRDRICVRDLLHAALAAQRQARRAHLRRYSWCRERKALATGRSRYSSAPWTRSKTACPTFCG